MEDAAAPTLARARLKGFVRSRWFHDGVVGLILLNSLILGIETYSRFDAYAAWFEAADRVIVWLFTLELLARLGAADTARAFFKDRWHWLDAAVVGLGHVPGAHFLTIIRLFRILRVLRAITEFPNLQRLVTAILRSLPSLGSVSLLLGILFYIYATAGTFLYRDVAPQHFGTLHQTVLTLFAVITLEGWVAIMRDVGAGAPWCWAYFLSFILLGTYIALNSFIAVIVTQLERLDDEDQMACLRRIEAAIGRLERLQPPGDRAGS